MKLSEITEEVTVGRVERRSQVEHIKGTRQEGSISEVGDSQGRKGLKEEVWPIMSNCVNNSSKTMTEKSFGFSKVSSLVIVA